MFSDSNENIRMKLSNINPAMTRKAPIVVVCVYVRACVCVAFLFRCSSVSMDVIRWDFYTRISQCTLSVSALFIYWVCIFIVCVRVCVCACQIHVRAMHTYRWCRMDEWNKPLLDLFIHLFERMNSSYFYPCPPPPLSSSVVHMHTARLQPPAPL